MFLNKIIQSKKKAAASLAVVIAAMAIIPAVSSFTTKGDVQFGTQTFPDAMVAEWDKAAEREFPGAWKRTDMEVFNHDVKGTGIQRLMGQTGGTKLSEWKDYEWKSAYCVAHDTANMTGNFEQYPVWYSFGYYTLQNMPRHFILTLDIEQKKFNFLMLAYATNYDNYIGGPIADPYYKTGNYYTMQLIAGICEKAEYTGEYQHDYDITKEGVVAFAEAEFHPNSLGSNQVYNDMIGNFDHKFNSIWNTATLLSKCTESTDEGYTYKAEKIKGEDGMTQVHLTYSDKLADILMSSKITTYGDWTYEFTPEYINFKSPTGNTPTEGKIAEVDAVGAANTIGMHIGTESVMSIRSPAKLKSNGQYTFMRTQENMVTSLKDGLKIIVSDGPSSEMQEGDYQMFRYKHSENWNTNYTVNLRKFDSETGKPLEGVKFDILEAFNDSQLDDTVLEDDNWENDNGTQFDMWDGWDAPEGTGGDDPCTKDEEITDEDGWLTGMTSIGGGSLTSDGKRAHNDTKAYSYTKGFCGGHPIPKFVEIPEPEYAEAEEGEEESDEIINQDEIDAAKAENDSLLKAYMSDIQLCFDLEDEGGYFCKADESDISVNIQDSYGYESKEEYESECIQIEDAKDELETDRDEHYVDFVSLEYQYSARESEPREGYIIHNQDSIHDVGENIDDTVHSDAIPIETVTVRSSEYYDYLADGIEHDSGGGTDEGPNEEYSAQRSVAGTYTASRITKISKADSEKETVSEPETAPESDATITVSSDYTEDDDFVFEDSEDVPDETASGNIDPERSYSIATNTDAGYSLKGRMIRSAFALKAPGDDEDDEDDGDSGGGARGSTQWTEPSIANNVVPGDSGYNGKGTDWEFILYDHRTEGEIHFNKQDLDLKAHESDQFSTYGTSQGDGTLEGAVYGLFAAADIIHPDGKTGAVFEKNNLVAVAATDRNGDGSFMSITEMPGSIFSEETGRVEKTAFNGPSNQYTQEKEQHSSNEENWNNSRWYYPIENNQANNGNCWIGRPLFLGSYYIKELTRSEGYELSVYGKNATITNRSAHMSGGSSLVNGSAEITKSSVVYRSKDDGTTEQVYEIVISSKETTGGYDVSVQGVKTDRDPEFYITEKGTEEVYHEWIEYETVYEQVLAAPGSQVIIGGKSVEAKAGDSVMLPDGTTVRVKETKDIEMTPNKIKRTGNSLIIPNISTKTVPDLSTTDTDDFVNECNKAFSKLSSHEIGKEAPYVLIELGDDNTLWAEKLHDYLASDSVPFTTARIEKTTTINGKTYAVLRYSFVLNNTVQNIVFVNSKNAFYQKYEVDYSDGTKGYLYKKYDLSGISSSDYNMSGTGFNWVMLTNEVPDKEQITLYEDLDAIPYKSNQQFKSLWVYAEGEYLRSNDGSIYQKPVVKEVKKNGYVAIDTYKDVLITGTLVNDVYKIHVNQDRIPSDGKVTLTIRYNGKDDHTGPSYNIKAGVFPAVDNSESFIEMVMLDYPINNKKIYSDGNTRAEPSNILERPIRQQVKVMKDIKTNPDGTYADDTYSKVHKENLSADGSDSWFTKATDWLTGLLNGNSGKETSVKIDNFRFKAYLKSNLERLYRDENGNIVWLDRNGNTLVPEYQDANNDGNYDTFTWTKTAQDGSGDSPVDFPEKQLMDNGSLQSSNVQKIYTQVEHNTNSTTTGDNSNNTWTGYADPQTGEIKNVGKFIGYTTSQDAANGEAIRTNASLYSFNGKNLNVKKTDRINDNQNTGYTRLLETTAQDGTNQTYDYKKFFDAMAAANTDKWDNDMFTSNKNYPGQHWFETFYEKYQLDDADPDFTIENTDGSDPDNTAGGDKDTSFKPFRWIREGIFKENGEERDYYNGVANNANIGNKINTSAVARENAEASDAVRQFAIDYHLQDEVSKLLQNNGRDEDEAIPVNGEMPTYADEVYDRALHNALIKAVNYLKPFYDNDLDTIYSVEWDKEMNGGTDGDYTTLNLAETENNKGYYHAISSYLPYGTYVLVEQQPSRIDGTVNDFTNKNYKTDLPKEVSLPSVYNGDKSNDTFDNLDPDYFYDTAKTPEDLAKDYYIRFNEEWADNHTDDLRNYVIRAHNFDGDYEVYKYGLDADKLKSTIAYQGGSYSYDGFTVTQDVFGPLKDYYNPIHKVNGKNITSADGANESNRYTADDKDYPHNDPGNRHYTPDEIEKRYHYGSVSEHSGTINGIQTMTGNQTAYEGRYASMLVPWTVVTPVDLDSYKSDDFKGFADMGFHNTFYGVNLRVEKLDSETGENILHDSAIFGLYAASRYTTQEEVEQAVAQGAPVTTKIGDAKFYLKDTTITGTYEFLVAMRADHIRPYEKIFGKDTNRYSGIVPIGTPVCVESEQIILYDGIGGKRGDMTVYTTANDVNMVAEEDASKAYHDQNTGYFVTPQPVGAGVYVLAELKPPSGYVRTKPIAIEVYSDAVTYYMNGDMNSRVEAAVYK